MSRLSEKYPVFVLRNRGWEESEEQYETIRDALRTVEQFKSDVIISLNSKELQENGITRSARNSDPADPPDNSFIIWQSDGTGTGDDGDLMIKITDSGGTTAIGTLMDYSTL